MQTPKRPVVLRFRFGKGLVKARKESENTARFIADRVALAYAQENWNDAKQELIQQITADLRAELVHMSSLFRRFIVGAPGTKSSPNGTLTTVAKGGGQPSAQLASMLPAWSPRNPDYMAAKRARSGGISWFDNSKWTNSGKQDRRFASRRPLTGSYGGGEGGYLKSAFKPDTLGGQTIWEEMFGNIGVRIVRNNKAFQDQGSISLPSERGSHIKKQLATIYVTALGRIDLDMLSGFRSENLKLSRLVYAHDPLLGMRLGRMNNGVYRPTLEPFLDFFLTRALPHAVSERIRKGSFGLTSRR